MKSVSSPHRVFGCVEPLEARIAPARIITGVPNNPQDPQSEDIDYNEAPFVNTETATDQISVAVGKGVVGVNDTYYLRLSAGDTLQVFNTTNGPQDYLIVHSGNVVAFFVDADLDKEVDEGELVSLSLGKDASVTLRSGLAGSILTNLDEKGTRSTLDDTIVMNGLVSGNQGIKYLSITRGDVSGKIMAGGNITNVNMVGRVDSILAGSATNGQTFEIFPGVGGAGTISFAPLAGQKGASIANIAIDAVGNTPGTGRIEAGAGGLGAAGGSLVNIRLTEEFDGFTLKAGNGGAAAFPNGRGGVGGSVVSVVVPGVRDDSPNDLMQIQAGHGGNSASGIGGAGGGVSGVYFGYLPIGGKLFPSSDLSRDNIRIEAGNGGNGKIGGVGGAIARLDLLVSTPDKVEPEGSTVDTNEIVLIAGTGGAAQNVAGAKAGVGGSLANIRASNVTLDPATSILLQAGAGGAAEGAIGAAGGSIVRTTLLGAELSVLAGNGSNGLIGGAGGDLIGLVVQQGEGVVSHVATFNAGKGGDGTVGNGGRGGNIVGLAIGNGDFSQLHINSGTAANGGNSASRLGGVGGTVKNLSVFEDDYGGFGYAGTMMLRSGNGGNGLRGGGNAGSLIGIDFTAEDLAADIRAGNGGNVVGQAAIGVGGNGGVIRSLNLVTEGLSAPGVFVSASVLSGTGGNGAGLRGSGGAGGDLVNLFVRSEGDASVTGGNGGSGGDVGGVGGVAGRGGSIVQAGVFATAGSGQLIAGDGGAAGVGPGNGGSIVGAGRRLTGLYASNSLTIQSGDGTNGGAGGLIRAIGYGSTADDLTPTPSGNILIQAGNGSAEGRFAGVGGSVINVTGAVGSSPNTFTHIFAGNGGGSADRSAAGGSVVDLRIQRGGSLLIDPTLPPEEPQPAPVELRILAGDAGDGGANVRVGAKGGDVSNVRIFEISQADDPFTLVNDATDTVIRSIAAGAGGDAAVAGGRGGSIDRVRVLDHDIGVRAGAAYGYDSMGGLFAGEGGNSLAGASGKGISGNVTNVSAKAIAAIVAGRGAVPLMAEKVESIYLYSSRPTAVAAVDLLEVEPKPGQPSDLMINEDLPNDDDRFYAFRIEAYLADNLVGAVKDPTRIDGNKFAFNDTNNNGVWDFAAGETPIDGLVMARVFNQARVNFTPEARVINGAFYDYDNRNA